MTKAGFGNNNYFVYGVHAVTAVLKYQPERCKKLLIARKDDQNIINEAKRQNVFIEPIDRASLEKRFNVSSDAQGLVLLCSPPSYSSLEDILSLNPKLLLVLDTWQDAINLGRAARSALCFGADAMLICSDRSASINASAEKAAVGALSRLPVALIANLHTALKKLKEHNFFIYGADERGDISLSNCDFAKHSALVIGQEGSGLRELTKKTCDLLIKIPMSKSDICLNAADAALLFLYQYQNR